VKLCIFVALLLILIITAGCGSGETPLPETDAGARADGGFAPPAIGTGEPPVVVSVPPDAGATPPAADVSPPADEPIAKPEDDDMIPEKEVEVPKAEESMPEPPPPPVFGFIDAHADTITRALLRDQDLLRSDILHVDFERLYAFGAPVQVFVLWCADRYVADAFNWTNTQIDHFEEAVARHSDMIEIALTLDDIHRIAGENKISAILSIEGGEALMGDINNLDHFYNRGVRIMAPTWNRENELGYGQATNSEEGLKPFGIECIIRMEELGMILDISHVNEAGFWDAHNTTTRPYMASHSNAYSVRVHNRNLRDDQIMAIVERGGIIGLALFPEILTHNRRANIDDMIAHIDHFIRLGAGSNLGLGCDLDGFSTMPDGFTDVTSLNILANKISEVYSKDISYQIMAGNFYDFFVRYFDGD